MSKKYVVEGAKLTCEFGSVLAKLSVPPDRHIKICGKLMANKADIGKYIGLFGTCYPSPYSSGTPCKSLVLLPWQNIKDNVLCGHREAVLEDSWTICSKCGGLISIVYSGQEESKDEDVIEKLKELEAFINSYIASSDNLTQDDFDRLFFGLIMWNGDRLRDTKERETLIGNINAPIAYKEIPWEFTSTPETRDICEKLREENPSLANYFERPIYITDPITNNKVDITYMIGMMHVKPRADEENFVNDRIAYFYNIPHEALLDHSQFIAHADAYLFKESMDSKSCWFDERMDSNLPYSTRIQNYYGIGIDLKDSVLYKNGRYQYKDFLSEDKIGKTITDSVASLQTAYSAINEIVPLDSIPTAIDKINVPVDAFLSQEEKYVPPYESKVREWGQSLEAFKYNISEETKNEIQKKLFDEDTKEREWKHLQEKKERELRKSQDKKD